MTHTCLPSQKQGGVILVDGCARCEEHAAAPWFSVDQETLKVLLERALAWETGEGDQPRNVTERAACQRMLDTLNAVRALFGLRSREAVVERLARG